MRYLRFSQAPCLFFFISLITTAAFGQGSASATREISLTVTVTDDDARTISGLRREWFSLFEKNTQLEITSFETFDKPASVMFLFDLSVSISDPVKNAAA